MKKTALVSLLICLAAGAVCAETAAPQDGAPAFGAWGLDLTSRDSAVTPGNNFYRFADGTYLDHVQIPPDRSRYGVFDALAILSESRVRSILETADPGSRIGAFYTAFMDEGRIEALGGRPIAPLVARINAVSDRAALIALISDPAAVARPLFGLDITPDFKAPDHYAVMLVSGGLGLPDRDYYLKPEMAAKKAAYQAYVADMLTLAAWPQPQKAAENIVAFETELAQASWERAALRNRDKTYNPKTRAELSAYAPGFDFDAALASADLGSVSRVILYDDTAFPTKAALFARTPLETLKAWAAFGVVDEAAPYLSKAFVQRRFEFRSRDLAGQPELKARWKRGVAETNDALGEAVGEVYVARYFPASAKAQMLDLVGDIRTALSRRIDEVDWMGEATKQAAQTKLARLTVKIGYPDKFRDYSALEIKSDDLFGDVERANRFEWRRQRDRLDKPVDRTEWGMSPQTVNAYYRPSANEIVFPAAILQPPFFDPKADPAVNFGGIGVVIGHEISHGFDDQGRKSDGEGRLADWWTPEDAQRFGARAERLAALYDGFEALPGQHVNGHLTLGEDIGDLGGVNIALDAYHASLKGRPAPVLEGLTGDQRFFLSFAQVWREKIREAALIQRLHTDPHPPGEARVNVVVRNVDAWYAAFGVKPGDILYLAPVDRVKIW